MLDLLFGLTFFLQQIRQLRLALITLNITISKLSLKGLQYFLGSCQCMFGFFDLLLKRSQSGSQLRGPLSRIFS